MTKGETTERGEQNSTASKRNLFALYLLFPSSILLKHRIMGTSQLQPQYTPGARNQRQRLEFSAWTTWWNRAILPPWTTPCPDISVRRRMNFPSFRDHSAHSPTRILTKAFVRYRHSSRCRGKRTEDQEAGGSHHPGLTPLCSTTLSLSQGHHQPDTAAETFDPFLCTSVSTHKHSPPMFPYLTVLSSTTPPPPGQVLLTYSHGAGGFLPLGPQSCSQTIL